MCMCIWKPEVSLNSYSSGAVYLVCEDMLSHLPGSHKEVGQVHQQPQESVWFHQGRPFLSFLVLILAW